MKKILNLLATVWIGLSTHKLRSSLTVLGVVIGIASVIALMSIGRGATADILSRIESMGSNLITISPGSSTFGGIRGAMGSVSTLSLEDAEAISEQIPYVVTIAPSRSSQLQVVVGGENMNSRITGVTTEYLEVNNLQIASGAFFNEYDYQRASKVAVIGSYVAETLFPDVDPVGQQIRMGNNIYRVTGVLESQGMSMRGSSDEVILIPLTALQQTVAQQRTAQGERVVSSISLRVSDEDKIDQIIEEITSLLRTRHQLGIGVDDDFSIMSVQEIAETMQETTQTMTLLLGAIAAISLLVGGIGVMNIMLVSVLERTREIGIRKALGARDRDIWIQFLIEAASLTFTGGVIGVIVGWGVSYLIPLISTNIGMGELTTVVSTDIVILAVSVSIGIGLFFGFYPAWNASRLNPIEALRSE